MTDLSFDFGDLPPPPIDQPVADTVADALIEKGLVPNTFILDLNKCLTVPYDMELDYPWNLPSRLFRFPIEVTAQDDDGSRTLGLLHPLLADHPFVKQVESAMGIAIDPDGAPNEFGYSKASTGQWWHAVDLISSGHWRELLDTAGFTTPEHIGGAVTYGLDYSPHEGKKREGHISTQDARKIMTAINSSEPDDRDAVIREHVSRPSCCKSEKGAERWPINTLSDDSYAKAWAHILGIEAGTLHMIAVVSLAGPFLAVSDFRRQSEWPFSSASNGQWLKRRLTLNLTRSPRVRLQPKPHSLRCSDGGWRSPAPAINAVRTSRLTVSKFPSRRKKRGIC